MSGFRIEGDDVEELTPAARKPGRPRNDPRGETWADRHPRVAWHIPREVLDAVKTAAKADGASASAWVAEALADTLERRESDEHR